MRESPQTGLTNVPARTAWIYAACAGSWVVLSDLAMALAMGHEASHLWVEIGKGLLFVAASAGLLCLLLRRGLRREAAVRSDLEAAQERLTSAVAHMPFTFAIYDADRRFRYLNTRGLLEANKPLDAVLGRRDEEVFPLEMVNAYLPLLNRALETRRAQTEVLDITLPSGHTHLAYTFTPLLNADGTVREVLGVTNDMTVVVRNERRVRRLNRTLAAVSAANSVLVRATDEPGLLRDFCAQLAAQTGHRLVWVGLVTPPDPVVHVAAQAGPAGGYLEGIEIRWDDTAAGRGPTGTCLRSRQPELCHDFTTDERMVPWRERAARFGMRASIALPLQTAGEMLGTLTLYSDEPHRFDEEEVRLLVELADDLAFGLVALRRELELHRTAAELAGQTAFFEAQVNSALDGILVVDSQGRQLLKNARFNEVWKIPRAIAEDMDDRKSLAFATSRTRNPAQFGEKVAHLYAHPEETSRDEIELVDGTVLDRYSSPVRGKDGRHHGRIWTFRDVTERKHAEAQMRDALAYLGTLIEASPVGIISYDETGQARTANAAAARITGGTEEQLLAMNFREIKSWQASGLLAAAERALARRQPEQVEAHFTTTFGKEVWTAAQFVPFQRGDAWHLLLLQTDISEQMRATAQLRLQGAALDAAANAIVITDAQGAILWVNPAFTKSAGYSLAEVFRQNPRLLKSGKHPREFYEGMWKTILAGHVWHGEMRNRRKDGTLYDEEMTIAPVRDAAGLVTHFIAIKQDISERKGLEQRFLRAQRLEGIGLLAGGIAHDLNNVLAPILMGADLLKLMARDEATASQLDSIVQSARRGADIVKQVLTFARGIEGERVLLHPRHVLKEMVRLARETFPRNIAFSTDIPGDLWPVIGDATQLHQVLLNLSVNARDALGEGGTLSYGAANVAVDDALAQANPGAKPGPHVMLRVKDTGSGIPPAVLDRMFEPFFTTKELGKGTGLGLSTVIGIVRSHGGFVTVTSEVGRGTTFEVYLPASPAAAGQLAAAQPEPLPRGHGELVLVVDDEAGILQVTRRMLEAHGYRVLTADDGTTALAQASQAPEEVALVITDVMMPFMDGVQLIRALRKLAPDLKVIASSGALGMPGQKDRTDEVLALGVKHILHKPYSVETLLRTVHAELQPDPPGT